MRVTADTITDKQIREMLDDPKSYFGLAWLAASDMCTALKMRRARPGTSRADARARCAEAWNARHGGE